MADCVRVDCPLVLGVLLLLLLRLVMAGVAKGGGGCGGCGVVVLMVRGEGGGGGGCNGRCGRRGGDRRAGEDGAEGSGELGGGSGGGEGGTGSLGTLTLGLKGGIRGQHLLHLECNVDRRMGSAVSVGARRPVDIAIVWESGGCGGRQWCGTFGWGWRGCWGREQGWIAQQARRVHPKWVDVERASVRRYVWDGPSGGRGGGGCAAARGAANPARPAVASGPAP